MAEGGGSRIGVTPRIIMFQAKPWSSKFGRCVGGQVVRAVRSPSISYERPSVDEYSRRVFARLDGPGPWHYPRQRSLRLILGEDKLSVRPRLPRIPWRGDYGHSWLDGADSSTESDLAAYVFRRLVAIKIAPPRSPPIRHVSLWVAAAIPPRRTSLPPNWCPGSAGRRPISAL